MPARKFKTTTYEAVMERINRGMSFEAIARELGCNPHHLRSAGSVLGIRSPYRGRPPGPGGSVSRDERIQKAIKRAKKVAEREAIVAESVKAGETLQVLAEKLGVTRGMACRYRQVYMATRESTRA